MAVSLSARAGGRALMSCVSGLSASRSPEPVGGSSAPSGPHRILHEGRPRFEPAPPARQVAIRLMLTLAHNEGKLSANGPEVRRWRRLVRIAYFDEAGIASEEQEPLAVTAGVLIHGDLQWSPVEIDLSAIVTNHVPQELWGAFYFHADHLYGNNKRFKGLLSPQTRFQILRELAGVIHKYELPISYSAIARTYVAEKLPQTNPSDRVRLAQQWSFASCAIGFQGWFNREAGDEVAICVADRKEKLEPSFKKLYQLLRLQGLGKDPFMTLSNFVDALHFAASEESIGLQLADCAAFLIKRHLMGRDNTEEFYKILEPHLCVAPTSAMMFD